MFDVPNAPEKGYPAQIMTIWEKIGNLQKAKCSDIGYAGESEGKELVKNQESDTVEEGKQDAAICARFLAPKALYPVFPLFRYTSREIVLVDRLNCLAISAIGCLFAKHRLNFFSFCVC